MSMVVVVVVAVEAMVVAMIITHQPHLRSAATASASASGAPQDDEEYAATNCSCMLLLTTMEGGTVSLAHATVNTPPPVISGVLVSAMVMDVSMGREQGRGGEGGDRSAQACAMSEGGGRGVAVMSGEGPPFELLRRRRRGGSGRLVCCAPKKVVLSSITSRFWRERCAYHL